MDRPTIAALPRGLALVAMIAMSVVVPAACADPAEVVFGINSEIAPGASFTALEARVVSGGEEVLRRRYEGFDLDFPLEIVPEGISGGDRVALELVALQGDTPIVRSRAETEAVSGRRLLYEIDIESECVAVACGEGSTCVDGACVDAFVDPAELPDYYPHWAGTGGGGLCEPGGPPEVILGEGQSDYHALKDGDVLQVEAGPQGGYHVWIAARLRNLGQAGSITSISGYFPDLDYAPTPSLLIFTFDPDEGGYCKIYGLRFRIDDDAHAVDDLLGQTIEITVEITDDDGDRASSTRRVRLSEDFI